MRLDGIHHISCITGDARANLDFYSRVMGLRLVARTVNQDDPYVYHLFYADHEGSPGAELTFFEYPGAIPGRAGAGMIHRIAFRVPSADAIDFWDARLSVEGVATSRTGDGGLDFRDPEGLGLGLVIDRSGDPPLRGRHPEIPAEFELLGFDHVAAYAGRAAHSARVLEEVMGAVGDGNRWTLQGRSRKGYIRLDEPPEAPGRPSAGTVHHVAWATELEEHDRWLDRLAGHGVESTPVIDRHYFRSIYFREPSGVLYELASKGPGFTVDDPLERLGSRLILPPKFEPRRAEIEARLTPLPDVSRP